MILSLPPCSLKYAAFTWSPLEWTVRAFVFHPARLGVPARQTAGLADLHAHADAETELEVLGERVAQAVALGPRERGRGIEAHEDIVEAVHAAEDDLELVDVAMRAHQLLDAARIDDDPPHLLHVVLPRQHTALEGDQRAPARAAAIGQLHDVARAVAQQRHRLAVEAGEHQLAALARLHRPALVVEHFRIHVVLVHVSETS